MADTDNNSDTKIPKPSDKGFVREAIERFEAAETFGSKLRNKAISDYKFAMLSGHQWDEHLTSKRRKRPCYEFNRLRQMIRRVTGQQLQNRVQIKIRPIGDEATVETADINMGLIRNINASSDTKLAYDNGFVWACAGGVGAWEVSVEYEGEGDTGQDLNPGLFNQCLKIKPIDDPFSVVFDPAARDFFRRDARFAFKSTLIPRSTFKRLYPTKQIVDFDRNLSTKSDLQWWYADSVRVAKYWYKEVEKQVIYLLNDGTVVDATEFDPIAREAKADGIEVLSAREVDRDCVYSCLISGKEKLTAPKKWPGKYIPIVLNWGEFHTVDGEQYYHGMTRFGRDAQMIHNFELSTLIEVVAKMPNSPLTATPKMIDGLKSYYERLGYDDPPVLLYNVDPQAPAARPTREPAATFPAAFANVSALAVDEIKATLGVYDASLSAQGNETSGRAILARQQEADVTNYVYISNHVKAIEFTGMILVDLVPKVFDATRSIRILGEDDQEKYVRVNRPIKDVETGEVKIINDLSKGGFDVTATAGKSFESQRMEVAEAAEAMARTPGPFGMLAQYLLFKNLDVPGMDEFVAACRRILVQQGLLEPGENDKPPPPPQPNPKDVADAELKSAQAQKAVAQTQQITALIPAQVEKTRVDTAESITRIAESLPTVPIGPSIFGPAPGQQPPMAPQ